MRTLSKRCECNGTLGFAAIFDHKRRLVLSERWLSVTQSLQECYNIVDLETYI